MPEKITFAEALTTIFMRELSTEKGEAVFDKMLARSLVSNVPLETNSAIQNLFKKVKSLKVTTEYEEEYKQVAAMLFEKEFPNPKLASYSVMYAQTMSHLKSWSRADALSEGYADLHRKLTNSLKRIKNPSKAAIVEKYADRLAAMLAETKPALQEFKTHTVSSCGSLVMLEEMGRKRKFPDGISERLMGGGFTDDDLTETRGKVEEYFSNPSKVARIRLLAKTRR